MINPALPRLLRAIAQSKQAQDNKHDIIFNAAANELEMFHEYIQALVEAHNVCISAGGVGWTRHVEPLLWAAHKATAQLRPKI